MLFNSDVKKFTFTTPAVPNICLFFYLFLLFVCLPVYAKHRGSNLPVYAKESCFDSARLCVENLIESHVSVETPGNR